MRSYIDMKFVGQIGLIEIPFIGVEIFKIEKQAFVMDEVRASMPRRHVKLDYAIARNTKRCNVVRVRFGAVSKIIWRSDPDEPFLALHRTKALAYAPVARHASEDKPVFL